MSETKNVEFPAKDGDPEQEVAQRSADGSDGTRFVKVFRVLTDSDEQTELDIERNSDGVLREAINRGLHPRGEVSYDGAELFEDFRGRKTWDFTYSVDTVPASVDSKPGDTTTPANNPAKPAAKDAGPDDIARNN